jgi:hypothetical protein
MLNWELIYCCDHVDDHAHDDYDDFRHLYDCDYEQSLGIFLVYSLL